MAIVRFPCTWLWLKQKANFSGGALSVNKQWQAARLRLLPCLKISLCDPMVMVILIRYNPESVCVTFPSITWLLFLPINSLVASRYRCFLCMFYARDRNDKRLDPSRLVLLNVRDCNVPLLPGRLSSSLITRLAAYIKVQLKFTAWTSMLITIPSIVIETLVLGQQLLARIANLHTSALDTSHVESPTLTAVSVQSIRVLFPSDLFRCNSISTGNDMSQLCHTFGHRY